MSNRCPTCGFLHAPIAVCSCGFCHHAEENVVREDGETRCFPWHLGWVRVWERKRQ